MHKTPHQAQLSTPRRAQWPYRGPWPGRVTARVGRVTRLSGRVTASCRAPRVPSRACSSSALRASLVRLRLRPTLLRPACRTPCAPNALLQSTRPAHARAVPACPSACCAPVARPAQRPAQLPSHNTIFCIAAKFQPN